MNKSLYFWQFAGFVFTSVVGTLLHFLYDWTGNNFVALFSAVNESVWEHMKLLFFPMLIFAIFENRYLSQEYENFWCIKLIGIAVGLMIIPTLYYTYTGALGVTADWFNIVIFFVAVAASYVFETHLFKESKSFCLYPLFAYSILLIIAVMFVIFTFNPPRIPLFQDPVTNLYGIV